MDDMKHKADDCSTTWKADWYFDFRLFKMHWIRARQSAFDQPLPGMTLERLNDVITKQPNRKEIERLGSYFTIEMPAPVITIACFGVCPLP